MDQDPGGRLMSAAQYPTPVEQQTPELLALASALGTIPPPCRAVDPEQWYAPDPRPAIRLCQDCHAKAECLTYARACGERFGVWGGRDMERRQQRRATRRAAS